MSESSLSPQISPTMSPTMSPTTLKKGWVLLTPTKIFTTITHEEQVMMDKLEFENRANKQMNEIVNRFLYEKRKEFELEGFDEYEIESMIEKLMEDKNKFEYDETSDEEEYFSNSDEDMY